MEEKGRLVRLWDLFSGEFSEKRSLRFIILSSAGIAAFSTLWVWTLIWIFSHFLPIGDRSIDVSSPDKIFSLACQVCIFAPIFEELAFRLLPFKILFLKITLEKMNLEESHYDVDLDKKETMMRLLSLGFWFSCIFFGISHGSLWNIFLQGFIGFAFWLQFLYCSRIGKDPARGICASILSHALYNLIQLISIVFR